MVLSSRVWIYAILTIFCGVVLLISLPGSTRGDQRYQNERHALSSIRDIIVAQKDFKINDYDRMAKLHYWRKDIAGLFFLKDSQGRHIKLISSSTAGADDRPCTEIVGIIRGPNAGYWYRTMRFAGEKVADLNRYAVCGFPDSHLSGIHTLIVSDDAIIYRKKGVLKDLEVYPVDPIKEGWERLK